MEIRREFYDARPRNFINGNKKPGLNFFQRFCWSNKEALLIIKN